MQYRHYRNNYRNNYHCEMSAFIQPCTPRTQDQTSATGLRCYLDLRADSLLQSQHVRYDTNQFAVLLQGCKGFQGGIQCIIVKSAKTLIQKQGIDTNLPARHLRQPQCQR